MRKTALILIAALLFVPIAAEASTGDDLLSLIAMPLAVAAVADIAGVPQDQLASLVSTMNAANVPPPQFVSVIRYVPVALVPQPSVQVQPAFVDYVQTQQASGLTGPALVTAMERRLEVYDVRPVTLIDVPATTLVERRDYIPQTVVMRVGSPVNPLALIAMPLAVAAVSDLSGVPMNQLADVAATLNNALVPPVQFVEVMRYVPVALVTPLSPQQPAFVEFVDSRYDQGLTGMALVTAIDQQFPVYGVTPQMTVEATRLAPMPVNSEEFFPPVVRTRMAQAGGNPHGGPPGQIKKTLGLQTGAEVVHGYKPGRQPGRVYESPGVAREHVAQGRGGGRAKHGRAGRVEQLPPMISSAPPRAHGGQGRGKKGHGGGSPMVMAPQPAPVMQPAPAMPPGQAKKQGGPPAGGPPAGGPPGQAKGHGHGKH